MKPKDRFGLELTATSTAAVADYVTGVDLLLSANDGAAPLFARALAAEPDFALARIAEARRLQLEARLPEARREAAAARAAARALPMRERRHVETIATAIDGDGTKALTMLREHVGEFPRDGVVLSLALGVYGLIGFSGRKDHHAVQHALLEQLAPHWGDDWWFLAYHGWSHVETGNVRIGATLVEQALAGNPRNAHGAHARAHAFYEIGDHAGAARFLAGFLPSYSRHGIQHGHLSWHHALALIACGDMGSALSIYADAIRPGANRAPPLPVLADAASLLWRSALLGAEGHDALWPEVAAHVQARFAQAGLAFADVHAALATAASGDRDGLAKRLDEIDRLEAAGRLPAGAVVHRICAGMGAFAAARYDEAIAMLGPALDDAPRIGGSHAQRELIENTLIVACLRARRRAPAEALLRRRLARRPSACDTRWLADLAD